MEQENKKLRDKAKKERNEVVRVRKKKSCHISTESRMRTESCESSPYLD
jgi:hypothetical protein